MSTPKRQRASRTQRRTDERQQANARLVGLPLTEWLALPRAERHRRARAARAEAKK
jgi:hypothetical protein